MCIIWINIHARLTSTPPSHKKTNLYVSTAFWRGKKKCVRWRSLERYMRMACYVLDTGICPPPPSANRVHSDSSSMIANGCDSVSAAMMAGRALRADGGGCPGEAGQRSSGARLQPLQRFQPNVQKHQRIKTTTHWRSRFCNSPPGSL